MSYYLAYVGEVIIKPEYREDFGRFFRGEYGRVESSPLTDFIGFKIADGTSLRYWQYNVDNFESLPCREPAKGRECFYDKATGVFSYSTIHEKCDPENELIYDILPAITEKVIFMNKEQDGAFFDSSGKVVIKPEYREEFEHLFRWEYDKLQYQPFKDWTKDTDRQKWWHFLVLRDWRHDNNKKAWRGKYQTSYDEASGLFVYGVHFNTTFYRYSMWDFFDELLPKITEKVISSDEWDEGRDDYDDEDEE